jgi:hypothetical protein
MMKNKPAKTLIVVTSAGSLPLLRYIGSRFADAGRPCAYLYMGAADDKFRMLSALAADWKIEAVSFESVLAAESATSRFRRLPGIRSSLVRALARALSVNVPDGILRAIEMQLATADVILEKIRPDAVIVAENGISGPMALLSRVKSRGIPIVTVPYGNARPHDIEIDLERKRLAGDRLEPSGREKWLMRLMMDRWIKKGREAGATMFQPQYIIALEALGITLEDPWIVQGGPMDVLCAESRTSFDQYLTEGMPANRICLTGSPFCDEMTESVRSEPASAAALLQPRLIERDKPRLLVSWPPDYHSTHIGKNEFASYAEMSARYFAFLASLKNCQITVSLHPSAGAIGNEVMRDNAIAPASEHLIGLIPRHDIFITFFSSAIRWAIAAGKPVVNIDLYDQRLPNFTHLKGVMHTRNLQNFSNALSDIVSSPEDYARLAAAQIGVAPDFGMMDGQCVTRIMSEVDRLTRHGGVWINR